MTINDPQYISIGTIISVIAFVLAFLQFLRPITQFRLSLGWLTLNLTFWILVIGTIFVFVATILPYIPGKAVPLLGYSAFWEILAGAIIVFTSLVLIYKSVRPSKFTKKNCDQYFDGVYNIIETNIPRNILDLTEEVSWSLDSIFSTIKRHELSENITDELRYALSLLELLADESFCQLMALHNPQTTYKFFSLAIENNLSQYKKCGHGLVKQLIAQLFVQRSSILYREKKYSSGLGRFDGLTQLIFGNIKFITSHYNPLEIWDHLELIKDITPWQINKYFEVMILALKKYLEKGENKKSYIFARSLGQIAEIIQLHAYSLEQLDSKQFEQSSPYKILSACIHGTWFLISFIKRHTDLFPKLNIQLDEEKYASSSTIINIYDAIARGLFDIIEAISITSKCRESVRLIFCDLYDDEGAIKEVERRFDILLLNKAKENLPGLHYPAVTANLIYALGLCEPSRTDIPIHSKIMQIIKQEFKKAFNKNKLIAMDMLPEDTIYHQNTNQLIRTVKFGRGRSREEILQLEE